MISSVFTLKGENVIKPNNLVGVSYTRLEENYYTNSALKFLLESEKELINCRQEFYKSLLEADTNYAINESFNDALAKAKQIIKKILAYIESIIKRFITQIAKFIGSDKYLSKMKDNIKKFSNSDSFYIDGYNFTINDTVPVVDIVGLDLSQLKDELRSVDDKNISAKMAKLSGLIADLSNEGEMDNIRGQILNSDNPITEADFTNQVFTIFRDGKSESSNLKIDREYVLKACDEYFNYKNKIKIVKSDQYRISNKYKSLESQINDVIKANMKIDGSSTIDVDIESDKYSTQYKTNLKVLLDNLINSQINQIRRISNLHVQAMAGKLDAYNALIIQDRNILYKALSKVQKDIKNTKVMESLDLYPDESNYDYNFDAICKGFVYETYYMNLRQHRFVQECLCLAENKIPELESINEDLKMDAKGKFQKLIDFIKQIYQKFLMKINKFITTNDAFLKKYKDIILTKRIEEYTLNNMPNYEAGIKNITSHKIQGIDIKNMLSESESGIQNKLLPAYKGDGEFNDFAKKYFLYNNEEPIPEKTSSTKLNMKDIYDFCVNAKTAIQTLESDSKVFEQETNKIKSEVLKAIESSKTTTNESFVPVKAYYSSVLGGYITEEDGPSIEKKDDNNSNAKSNAKLDLNVPKPDHNNSEKNKDMDKQVKKEYDAKDSKTQAEENKNSDAKKVQETADWYLNSLRTVCTAKITAFQKIYTEYMKILRYHVQQATGDMGSSSNFKEEDVKQIEQAMKDYLNGNKDQKDAAAKKIIDIYKSKNMTLDVHAVDNLVNKNKDKLGG